MIGTDMHGLRVAIPYLRRYQGGTFVIKLGGGLCRPGPAIANICEQIAMLHQLGIRVIVVHGGGPQADELARQLGHQPERVGGRRVTDTATLAIVQQAFGAINTDLLGAFRAVQVPAIGISGVDGALVTANRRPPQQVTDASGNERTVDFGFVGDITTIDASVLHRLHENGFLPVVASLAADASGQILNVNADTVAARLAAAAGAQKLFILTDVDGVFRQADDPTSFCSQLDLPEVADLKAGGAVSGGMLPKLDACRLALEGGVPRAHIINGRQPDSLLAEIFTNEGCGTLLVRESTPAADAAVRVAR